MLDSERILMKSKNESNSEAREILDWTMYASWMSSAARFWRRSKR